MTEVGDMKLFNNCTFLLFAKGSYQQYSLSAFGLQPQPAAAALNLPIQPMAVSNLSQLKHSAPPFKPASQRVVVSPTAHLQVGECSFCTTLEHEVQHFVTSVVVYKFVGDLSTC